MPRGMPLEIIGHKVLIRQVRREHPGHMWAGPDQRHVALDDIDQLWNFIEAGFAEPFTDTRNPGIALHRLFHAASIASIRAHRTEFINLEETASISVAILEKQHGPGRCDFN